MSRQAAVLLTGRGVDLGSLRRRRPRPSRPAWYQANADPRAALWRAGWGVDRRSDLGVTVTSCEEE